MGVVLMRIVTLVFLEIGVKLNEVFGSKSRHFQSHTVV